MKIKVLLLALVFIFPSLTAHAADDDRRDGNWWREQQQLIKLGYMIGFLDGEHLGNKFSYWKFMNDPDGQSCLTKVVNSASDYHEKFLSKVKVGQLVDGLDDFYSDYKNRSLRVDDAVWLVLNGIAGTPKDKLDKMIEAHRRSAP